MNVQQVIAAKRDGRKHTRAEIEFLVRAATTGEAADYQLAAWLMAAYLHPLDEEETAWLTLEMAHSGATLDLSELPKPWLDKHSTGGVGDKTSLVVLPILAACGLTVVKMSGRGLGITGGTIDKLASVPGFRTDLSPEQMIEQAKRVGIALTGQTPALAPADKAFYSLRDATATIGSIPLIVSSILSKKIAGGSDVIVLDVKCGSGGFMKSLEESRALAMALRATAKLCGLEARVAISEMDQPLGSAVGNALEVIEAAEVLAGVARGRFEELCVTLSGMALQATGKAPSLSEGEAIGRRALESGQAMACAKRWFEAQGANPSVLDDPRGKLPRAAVTHIVHWPGHDGWVSRIDAGIVGEAVLGLGGGRRRKDDEIDPSVGVRVHKVVGDQVRRDDKLFEVHARSDADAVSATDALLGCVTVDARHVDHRPVILERL